MATVDLNGDVLARTANMHRTYRLDVGDLLQEGTNRLSVTFESPVRYADRTSLELGARPHVNHHPFNAIRKMACNFGWDWGPDVATAGIWRPVTLQSWRTARLAAVRPVVEVDGARGVVAVHVDVERADVSGSVTVEATVGETEGTLTLGPGETSGVVSLVVDDVALWWPRGHGDQPLYDLDVRLQDGVDGLLDEWSTPARLPHGAPRDRARRRRDELHLRRQRPADLRQGRQLDPRRRLPAPGGPGALRRPARAGRGGGGQPAAGLGRRHLRGRRLLRASATSAG